MIKINIKARLICAISVLITTANVACLAQSGSGVPPGTVQSTETQSQQKWIESVDRVVHLTPDQSAKMKELVDQFGTQLTAIETDSSPESKDARKAKLKAELKQQLLALLTPDQAKALAKARDPLSKLPVKLAIGVDYGTYFPSGSTARSIFGQSSSSIGVSLTDIAQLGDNTALGFSLSDVSIENNGNKLFLIAPQLSIARWQRITKEVSVYERLGAGPAYMDYSFDTPNGQHFGAKRLGGQILGEIGFRCFDRLQLGLSYHVLTEPAGINFNGFEFNARVILFRF